MGWYFLRQDASCAPSGGNASLPHGGVQNIYAVAQTGEANVETR